MSLPIYKAVIQSEEDVMDFMGFVEQPAHGKSMRFFKPDEKPSFKFNDVRQLVTGVAIATNQPIYRRDDMGEYHMYFDKQTTRELGRRLLQHNFGGNVNINHDHTKIVKSARIDEIFYVDKQRGIEAPQEFADQNLQDGSMLITYHISDKKEYEELKSKNLKGFSIEVFIDVERTNFQNQKTNKMKKNQEGFFKHIKDYFSSEGVEQEPKKEFAEAVTVDGATIRWEGELIPNETVIYLVAEGEEDILAPEGIHVIEQNDIQLMLTVGADGVLMSVEEVEADEMSEEQQAIEMNAQQIVALRKENEELKKANKEFYKRFENIEKQLDDKPSKKFNQKPTKSVGQAIRS